MSNPLHIEKIEDPSRIETTMRHPSIYPHISDDRAWDWPDFSEALKQEVLLGLAVMDGEEQVGCFMLARHDGIVSLHTMLLPQCRGKRGREACDRMREWLLANTYIETLFTHYYSNRPHVGAFARTYGFREDGHVEDVTIRGEPAQMVRMVQHLTR